MIRYFALSIATGVISLAVSLVARAAEKPNVLVIYSDDHGWADLGAQGVNGDIRTPNLDQLARDGVRFTRGYVSAPQCVPSRAGLITGRYQQRFGVEDNNRGPLPLAELTIAERLKAAGYLTGQVGKWHLDIGGEKGGKKEVRVQREFMPHAQGFDEYWRGELRQFFASHDLKSAPFTDAPHLVTDDRFRITVQTEATLAFLDRRVAKPEQPWFLYLAWFAPHVPLESPEPWFSQTPEHLPKERRQALAMIAAMDDGLGRIRAKLREMGAEKDTLIFFIGDNGAPVKPGHWDGSLNLPLIGEKGMLTDGGIRTPFVAAWPGKIPAGRVFDKPVINLDVAATAVALAGLPRDATLDGVNLLPFLTSEDKAAPHDALYWRWRSQAAVLEFPWKLIRLGPSERFLFDVTMPEGESHNLLAQHPDIAARLDAKLKTWSDTLQPPGLPTETNQQDAIFFADHVEKRLAPEPKRAAEAPGSIQGWLCRNGTIALRDGALVITPDSQAKGVPFLTYSQLDLPGPATLSLQTRGSTGGEGSVTWRTRQESEFDPAKRASFRWPEGGAAQSVRARIQDAGRLIHVRIYVPKTGSIEVQSITLEHEGQPPQTWRFDSPKPAQ